MGGAVHAVGDPTDQLEEAWSPLARSTGLALAATLAVGFACGDDDPTGPGSVTFPDWPATIITGFCVRGTAVVGDTKSGTLSDTDCDVADIDPSDVGYFEVWRVRVASARDVTFDASSTFDNVLVVLRVNAVTATRRGRRRRWWERRPLGDRYQRTRHRATGA